MEMKTRKKLTNFKQKLAENQVKHVKHSIRA